MNKKRGLYWTGSCLLLVLLLGVLAGCGPKETEPQDAPDIDGAERAVFASYSEPTVTVQPKVPPYKINRDLSNITNASSFEWSEKAAQQLAENYFVMQSGYQQEFFPLYEENRYDKIPNFVTTDSMLHTYHLYYDYLLRSVEEEKLAANVKKMTERLLQGSLEQAKGLKDAEWIAAAERSAAYFAVADALIRGGAPVLPAGKAKTAAEQELALIKGAQGIAPSPVMNMEPRDKAAERAMEDYSQYIPRGHYTKSEALKRYFRAMMWYGRQTFRAADEQQMKSAVLISRALTESAEAGKMWMDIYETTNFFVGESDDPGMLDLHRLIEQTYGAAVKPEALEDAKNFDKLMKAAARLKPPALNSVPIWLSRTAEEREQKIAGFRLMGQRYTIDANIFQRLIYPAVGKNAQGETRMLPNAFDIPAALGAEAAEAILKEEGCFDYAKYGENLQELKEKVSSLEDATWTSNLYWGWMNTLRPLAVAAPTGYPSFMLTEGWKMKNLNTFKASWTELKHDTILYSKQVYAEMGGGSMPGENLDDRGYVEPAPTLYARLAALTKMTRTGLEERALISPNDVASLNKLEALARSLMQISVKELENQRLTDEEYELIRSYGGQLEHFWLDALKNAPNADNQRELLNGNPAALIADVATDPNGNRVLEEGTGLVEEIYVVVPVDGQLRIASGSVWSTYEFTVPLAQRMTDEQWREMVLTGETKGCFDWTKRLRDPEFFRYRVE